MGKGEILKTLESLVCEWETMCYCWPSWLHINVLIPISSKMPLLIILLGFLTFEAPLDLS